MKKISGFIISLALSLPLLCNGQDTTRYPINEMKGIRIGIDLAKLAFPFIYDKERVGFEVSVDKFIWKNIFGVAEVGWLDVDLDRDTYHYQLNGLYGKLGIDYNLLKSRRPFSNDLFYAGFRYGMSFFSHKADDITVPGYYWPDASSQSISKTSMNAHWIELLMGVKAEVLKNFYIGLIFRGKFRIASPKGKYSNAYVIPGYGNGADGFSLGLNYYISYNIKF
ncbi:MAG: DUF6048 family protein [Bacteroidales bacterium]|jgi:hypothetical protein|nr:DUF6048 family protein [Bacteroidales bacterium]